MRTPSITSIPPLQQRLGDRGIDVFHGHPAVRRSDLIEEAHDVVGEEPRRLGEIRAAVKDRDRPAGAGVVAALARVVAQAGAEDRLGLVERRIGEAYPGLFIRVADLVCGHGSSC